MTGASERPDASSPAPANECVRERLIARTRRDTRPELLLRRQLFAAGFCGRMNRPVVPRTRRRRVGIAFTRPRVAAFVDGHLWHRCPDRGNELPNSREWWRAKLVRKVARDPDTDVRLEGASWIVLRFWEQMNLDDEAKHVHGCSDLTL